MSIIKNPFSYWWILLILLGCQTKRVEHFPAEATTQYRAHKISAITLKNGEHIFFNNAGGRYIEERRESIVAARITGIDDASTIQEHNLSSILEVETIITQWDDTATFLYIGGVFTAFAILLILFTPLPRVG